MSRALSLRRSLSRARARSLSLRCVALSLGVRLSVGPTLPYRHSLYSARTSTGASSTTTSIPITITPATTTTYHVESIEGHFDYLNQSRKTEDEAQPPQHHADNLAVKTSESHSG